MVIAIVAIGVAMVIGAADRTGSGGGGSGGGPPGGYAPELEPDWTVASNDITGDYGTFDGADGSVPGAILETAPGWVTMVEASTLTAKLVSLEPTSGDVRWSIPVPEARCTSRGEEAIVCLTRSNGSTFEIVTVDAETGAQVGDPAATEVAHVPVFVAPLGEDGLVVFTMAADLIGLDVQGRTLWSEEIDTHDYEVDWIQPDVASLGDTTILLMGSYIGTAQATADGVVMHDCRGVAVTEQAWMCTGEDDAIGYAPDGTELWREPWNDYYLVDQYEHIAPVIIVDNWDGTVSGVDPLSGKHGPAVEVSDDRDGAFSFLGDPEHPFVFTADTVSLLDADLRTVLWTTPVEDSYLGIAGGGVIEDTLVIDAEHSYGVDVDTGEVLWERAFLPFDAIVVGDAFVGLRASELIRYQLP